MYIVVSSPEVRTEWKLHKVWPTEDKDSNDLVIWEMKTHFATLTIVLDSSSHAEINRLSQSRTILFDSSRSSS